MADVSTAYVQALALARRIEVWTSNDATSGRAYTEQGPRPGVPVAGRASHAVLVPAGTPSGATGYDVRCQHGGIPGMIDHGMTVAARRTGEPLYLGWEPPGVITGWDGISYDSATTDEEPHCCTMPDDSVIVVARRGLSLLSWTRDPVTGAWSGPVTIRNAVTKVYWPCLVVVEDEVYCLAWHQGMTVYSGQQRYFISAWRSLDSGATWEVAQNYATTQDKIVMGAPSWAGTDKWYGQRIRAAYRDGEVCVLAHMVANVNSGDADYIMQFAGPALTMRLDHVATMQGAHGWGMPDIVATPTGFLAAYVERTVSEAKTVTIGSAWQPISTGRVVEADVYGAGKGWSNPVGTVVVLDGVVGLALAWDPAGIGVLIVSDGDEGSPVPIAAGRVFCHYTADGGESWSPASERQDALAAYGHLYWAPDAGGAGVMDHYPHQYGACYQRGRICWAHNWVAAIGVFDDSIAVAYLGGWSDLEVSYANNGVRMGSRSSWAWTWMPFERPDDQAYTTVSGGVSSAGLSASDNGVSIITTGDGTGAGGVGHHYYEIGAAPVLAELYGELEWEMTLITGGSDAAEEIAVHYRLANAASGVEVGIRYYSTGLKAIDLVSGATLATLAGLTDTSYYQYRLGIYLNTEFVLSRSVQLWYRSADSSETRRWTNVGKWLLTDDGGAGGVTPRVRIGHFADGGGVTINRSRWRRWAIGFTHTDVMVAAQWATLDQAGGDNPTLLRGRPLGSASAWALDGLLLAGRRGPGLIGDTWTIPASGDYEINRAISLDAPSRRIHHRTVDVSADVVIPWAADPDRPHAEDTEYPPLVALHVECNWRRAMLQYKTVAGAWTTSAIIDTRVLQDVAYVRAGRTLRGNAGGGTVYLLRDETTENWTIEWDDGAGTTRYRHPAGNTEGRWSNSTTEPRARIELASTLAGDPTGGGKLSLWSPSVTVIVPGVTATAWRLVIDSTHGTADGDYRTRLYWLDVHMLAVRPGWGRGFTAVPGHEWVELEGGVEVGIDRAPPGALLRLAWDEGIVESEIHQSAVAVRSVTGYSGGVEPVAAVGAVSGSLVRALERQRQLPLVWACWPRGASGVVTLRRPGEHMLALAESAPTVEVVSGDEWASEHVRIGKVTLRRVR